MGLERALYDFGLGDDDKLRQGLPPVVGDEGGSTWFAGASHGHAPLDVVITDGMYLGIDAQPDHHEEQVVCGTATSGGSALRLMLCEGGVPGRVSVMLRDEDGRVLEGSAQGSTARARRLLVRATPKENVLSVHEIQPWADVPGAPLPLEITRADSPSNVVLRAEFAIGGWMVDGTRQSTFRGRLAEFFLGGHSIEEHRVQALAAASTNPMSLTFAELGATSAEMNDQFLRNLARLRKWCSQSTLSPDDMDDACLLLHRWLIDRTAILDVLTRRAGVQLWLPGPSEQAKRYIEAVLADGPELHLQGELGPTAIMGFEWVDLATWRSAAAFHARGTAVSREAFVKFVRNKLGPGHFDEDDRKRWQRDLLEVTRPLTLLSQDALTFQMHALLREALLAVSVSRAEGLAEAG